MAVREALHTAVSECEPSVSRLDVNVATPATTVRVARRVAPSKNDTLPPGAAFAGSVMVAVITTPSPVTGVAFERPRSTDGPATAGPTWTTAAAPALALPLSDTVMASTYPPSAA